MAVDVERITSGFLLALGAPDGPLMRAAVHTWMRKEGISSVKRNNPWNLHGGKACLDPSGLCQGGGTHKGQIARANVGPGDKNVAVFATLDDGIAASAANLVRLRNSGFGYDKVIEAARAGDPVRFLHKLARSSWSAGRYGTKNGGPNSLIPIWNGLTGRNDDPLGYKVDGPGPIIEEDGVDPRTHIPVAVCDVAGPTTVFGDSRGLSLLIGSWVGSTNVGLYARPSAPTTAGKPSLVPIRIDLKSGPPEDLRVGWVGVDRVANIRLG